MTAFNYTNQTVLITGASSGIGRVFAETLAARGAHVLLLARSGAVLEQLARDLARRHGIRAHAGELGHFAARAGDHTGADFNHFHFFQRPAAIIGRGFQVNYQPVRHVQLP